MPKTWDISWRNKVFVFAFFALKVEFYKLKFEVCKYHNWTVIKGKGIRTGLKPTTPYYEVGSASSLGQKVKIFVSMDVGSGGPGAHGLL